MISKLSPYIFDVSHKGRLMCKNVRYISHDVHNDTLS